MIHGSIFSVTPKIRTLVNDRSGFFTHKLVLKNILNIMPWQGGLFTANVEAPLYNEYDTLLIDPLENEAATTDFKLYEERDSAHLTQLSFDQVFRLPHSVYARASAGIFEAAYAGFGGEAFRFFNDGLWGAGVEVETVRKRDRDNDFALSDTDTKWRTPAYLNLYAQLWPSQGIEGGLKIGRFLAGDVGARVELRRTFKYFTLGAWLTKTDDSVFDSELKQRRLAKRGLHHLPPRLFQAARSPNAGPVTPSPVSPVTRAEPYPNPGPFARLIPLVRRCLLSNILTILGIRIGDRRRAKG